MHHATGSAIDAAMDFCSRHGNLAAGTTQAAVPMCHPKDAPNSARVSGGPVAPPAEPPYSGRHATAWPQGLWRLSKGDIHSITIAKHHTRILLYCCVASTMKCSRCCAMRSTSAALMAGELTFFSRSLKSLTIHLSYTIARSLRNFILLSRLLCCSAT
jgi:hypothetical protein